MWSVELSYVNSNQRSVIFIKLCLNKSGMYYADGAESADAANYCLMTQRSLERSRAEGCSPCRNVMPR